MIGVIVGDIAGSRFEFDNHKSKDFELRRSIPLSQNFSAIAKGAHDDRDECNKRILLYMPKLAWHQKV